MKTWVNEAAKTMQWLKAPVAKQEDLKLDTWGKERNVS